MEEQSFREFISGLSDREARKLSGACQSSAEARSAEVQRGARMPGQRRAGKLVQNKIETVVMTSLSKKFAHFEIFKG